MRVTAFNGSPNKKGNTYKLLSIVLAELENEGIDTELIQLAPLGIKPCTACFRCADAKDNGCHGVKDDTLNELMEKMLESDGIIIGSPTWFGNVSGHVKNLIDRAGLVSRVNGINLDRKVGAAVTAVRRAGGVQTMQAINNFFQINGMIMPGGFYWPMGYSGTSGNSTDDEEGVKTMERLGRNMAWLLRKIGE